MAMCWLKITEKKLSLSKFNSCEHLLAVIALFNFKLKNGNWCNLALHIYKHIKSSPLDVYKHIKFHVQE